MRVITGTARGRKLREPTGRDIRPTTDMVKESVFNIIQFKTEGARVLDLFAGTGQLGIEALSRGAAECVFVDKSEEALKLVRENLKTTGLENKAHVVRGDSLSYLRSGEKFDIVFVDPPYDTDLLEKSLNLATGFDILRENGIIICESRKEKPVQPPAREGYTAKEYRYGRIKLTVFRKD
ncbi:MAG: 16S rRNA (guanine(966)-N(2))-methyltransferase RsmD [Oscillospiraceae bacterium]|nr:16S rRNA (guanine(966)-N(2))-methyltransferase RsmD [Oscillospiraceae bacterium]